MKHTKGTAGRRAGRFLALALSAAMVLSSAGCAGKGGSQPSGQAESGQAGAGQTQAAAAGSGKIVNIGVTSSLNTLNPLLMDGVEMNKFYLDQLSTHPDLTSPNVLDVLRELSEVATLAVVTNGFDRVQGRRVRESGILDFVEDVFVSEKMDSEKPNRKIFDAALRALGVENREHVLMVGDSLSSDVQGGVNAGLDTCWYNPNHAENPGKVVPTYEISSLEELYPLVMEPEELANVGLKNRRHQL